MSRLTNHFDYCEYSECGFYNKELAKENKCGFFNISRGTCHSRSIYNKLVEYEDLEEQELLIKLPCKIGTMVYMIDIIYECKYDYLDCPMEYPLDKYKCERDYECSYEIEKLVARPIGFKLDMVDNFGKTVFLTKEEAKEELKRRNDFNE